MSRGKIIVSRKAAILIVSISLFILGFQILNVNMPDDIDITSGFKTASAIATPQEPEQPKQIEMPPTTTAPTTPPLPPIDLVALRIKKTEELARIDYKRMQLAQKYIRETPQPKSFETTCYDPRYGYFVCIVTQ